MFTSLDLLVIIFMGIFALTLLSLCLMFLLKNKIAKRVCFYVVTVLGLYVSTIGLRIGLGGWFTVQIAVSVLTVAAGVAALVLDLIAKDDEKKRRIARILSAVTLLVALINAFIL